MRSAAPADPLPSEARAGQTKRLLHLLAPADWPPSSSGRARFAASRARQLTKRPASEIGINGFKVGFGAPPDNKTSFENAPSSLDPVGQEGLRQSGVAAAAAADRRTGRPDRRRSLERLLERADGSASSPTPNGRASRAPRASRAYESKREMHMRIIRRANGERRSSNAHDVTCSS